MRGKWICTVLTAVPLLFGGLACGKKKEKTEPAQKTEKTVAGKTNLGKSPGQSSKTDPRGDITGIRGKQPGSKRGGLFSGNGAPPVKIGTTATAPTAKQPIDTQYITDDFVLAVVGHPARVLNGKFAQEIKSIVEKEIGKNKVEAGIQKGIKDLGLDPRTVEQGILLVDKKLAQQGVMMLMMGGGRKEQRKPDYSPRRKEGPRFPDKSEPPKFPKPERKIEKTKAGLAPSRDTQFVSTNFQPPGPPGGGQMAPPIPSGIVRFNKAPDQKALLELIHKRIIERPMPRDESPIRKPIRTKEKEPLQKKKGEKLPPEGKVDPSPSGPPIVTKKHADKEYKLIGPLALCFVNDKTLLFSNEELLKKMIAAKGVKSPLTNRLKTIGAEHDFILALDVSPLQGLIAMAAANPPEDPKAREGIGYLQKLQTVALTCGITGETLASAVLQFADASSAAGVTEMFKTEFAKAAGMAKSKLKKVEDVPPAARPIIEELANGFSVQQNGNDVVIALQRPKSLDELPKQLPGLIKKVQEAARQAQRKNDLRQIGLAFHNYHDIYTHFPAADSSGYTRNGKIAHAGLSWRVHLLPLLEQKNLYDQFKLDEPWDSAHNKKLIPMMPKVFITPGVTEPGKTSLHVFVGSGTPFGMPRGSRIRDFTDGTSNTLLVVEAGPDKADVWTKPGGLPFDASKNPVELLGKYKSSEFLALFCDGSVTAIKTSIKPETLKLLIQPSDGNVIPNDPALQRYREFRRRERSFDRKTPAFGPGEAKAPDRSFPPAKKR